jgi:hypothetical protein
MAPALTTYEPRDPSRTVLYTVIADQLVVSLSLADNVSRPLPCLLQGVHQPVIRSRNSFSRPRSACLACI